MLNKEGMALFPLIEKKLAETRRLFRCISEALTHMLAGYVPKRTQISLSLVSPFPSLMYPALVLWPGLEAWALKIDSLEFKPWLSHFIEL